MIKKRSISQSSKKSDDSISQIDKNIEKIEDPYGSIYINQKPKNSHN